MSNRSTPPLKATSAQESARRRNQAGHAQEVRRSVETEQKARIFRLQKEARRLEAQEREQARLRGKAALNGPRTF